MYISIDQNIPYYRYIYIYIYIYIYYKSEIILANIIAIKRDFE